jgi:tRNA modification GTPase
MDGRIPADGYCAGRLRLAHALQSPGEFTRRAFLNGRMDLAQAEAVQDLIRAKSERAAAAAMEQLAGRLSHRLNQIYTELMAAACGNGSKLDFPDDEMQPIDFSNVRKRMEAGLNAVRQLASTWEEGHYLRDGLKVVMPQAKCRQVNPHESPARQTALNRIRHARYNS